MKCFLVFMSTFFLYAVGICNALEKPLIDPEQKKIDEAIDKNDAKCFEISKNPGLQLECAKKLRYKYQDAGKMRGSEEYCEKHYKNLSFKELESLFRKFKQQQKTARGSYKVFSRGDRKPGEVTKEDLQTEIVWIESQLARRQEQAYQREKKKLNIIKVK